MAKSRSPNYPNYDLRSAITMADKIFGKGGRNKVSRAIVATHLGHDSLSGPALGKIGALRAYGLLAGSGDDLRVSDDAIAALKAPQGSEARGDAVRRLAGNPTLFQLISKEYPALPSKETLEWWLVQQGFSETASGIAAESYLQTRAFVDSLGGIGNDSRDDEKDHEQDDPKKKPPSRAKNETDQRVKIMEGERELTTGLLAKGTNFRLIVSGPIGVKEIERLISKLELDKEILAEPEDKTDADETGN